jgi:chromosome segregation ATPase
MNNEELKPPIENEPANKPQEENVSLAQFTELSDSLQALGQDVAEMRKSIKRSSVAMERHRARHSRAETPLLSPPPVIKESVLARQRP